MVFAGGCPGGSINLTVLSEMPDEIFTAARESHSLAFVLSRFVHIIRKPGGRAVLQGIMTVEDFDGVNDLYQLSLPDAPPLVSAKREVKNTPSSSPNSVLTEGFSSLGAVGPTFFAGGHGNPQEVVGVDGLPVADTTFFL